MRTVTLALLVLFVLPVWASEPGQPLDCSDWVFLEPGLTCAVVESRPCDSSYLCGAPLDKQGAPRVIDNSGRTLIVRLIDTQETCVRVNGPVPLHRFELVAFEDGQEMILATIAERCVPVPGTTYSRIDAVGQKPWSPALVEYDGVLMFDPVAGRVVVPLFSQCVRGGNSWECPSDYNTGPWVAAIEGLATLFDIFHSYTPTSGPISFKVPYYPEGLRHADYFDTYYGDLATVGDWPQAQPLQCGYPATAPSVGDYLTVEDTLPTPAPGRGYYFVTAVNYQGQRRYGRQSNGDVLTGRDPTALPECVE